MHRYRLEMPAQKKKSANIFVCSMADLFGAWVPDSWIEEVFRACEAAPWHNYLFLTKCPQRYGQLDTLALLPRSGNFWYGTTITRNVDLNRIGYLPLEANRFISTESILEPIDLGSRPLQSAIPFVDWIIVGAETGNRRGKVKPERRWIEAISETARSAGIPVLMKHSKELEEIWGEELIQEFPAALSRPKDKPIPHCSECEYHRATERHYNERHGKTIMNHFCTNGEAGRKTIPGRYVRTSPPWCPLRGEEKER